MYRCIHTFNILTLHYYKGQVITADEYNGVPWGYKAYFVINVKERV